MRDPPRLLADLPWFHQPTVPVNDTSTKVRNFSRMTTVLSPFKFAALSAFKRACSRSHYPSRSRVESRYPETIARESTKTRTRRFFDENFRRDGDRRCPFHFVRSRDREILLRCSVNEKEKRERKKGGDLSRTRRSKKRGLNIHMRVCRTLMTSS